MTNITHPYRTHTCAQLRESDVGTTVRLSGWVYRKREQKHHVFVDLRDHYGVTQLAFTDDHAEALAAARELRPESVIVVDGAVVARERANAKMETGAIELSVTSFTVDSLCEKLEIQVQIPKGESDLKDEENRLRWRFLDLRRERIHQNMVLRDKIIRHMRDHMHSEGFLEVQTPILTNSSPEGARDYLVPSRVHPGKFFALPQAPQQWKQLLMASGFDKYFQIAPCFRDEDARADRAPGEFYQLDMEMAYVTQDDVFGVIERLYNDLPDKVEVPGRPKKIIKEFPFPRIKYWDSMDRFGSDKPDLRFGLELEDVGDIFKSTKLPFFSDALAASGRIKALRIRGGAKAGKGYVRKLEKHVKQLNFGGLPHLIYTADKVDGSIKKAVTPEEAAALRERLGCEAGDLVVFGFGSRLEAAKVLGAVRMKVTEDRMQGLYVRDVSEFFLRTKHEALAAGLTEGGSLKALRVPQGLLDDGYADELIASLEGLGRPAMMAFSWKKQGRNLDGTIDGAMSNKGKMEFEKTLECEPGDLIIIDAGTALDVGTSLSDTLTRVCTKHDLPDPRVMGFCFIVDYPFYELDDEGKVDFSHNPFSMPQGGLEALETKDPLDINAWQYDICCNGIELSSGAIRNHRPDVMYKAFEIVGYTREQIDNEFGHMIRAFSYGAPPHGGMAPGVDRTVMLYLDEPNIREVVAFPKNQQCQDMLANSPSYVRAEQLEELNLSFSLDGLKACPHCAEKNAPFQLRVGDYLEVRCESCKPS